MVSCFSTNNRKSRRAGAFGSRYAQPGASNAGEDLPQFAGLLRQFYRQSHPDLLRASHAEFADINDQSWQTLNGILSTIKEVNSYPPRMTKTIPFYLRAANTESGLKHIELTVRTGGGDCKKQLTVTMQDFFVASGISADGKFTWGKEYFPLEVAGAVEEEEEL
jgi:hypothetical protein